jgi:hypothetical protein
VARFDMQIISVISDSLMITIGSGKLAANQGNKKAGPSLTPPLYIIKGELLMNRSTTFSIHRIRSCRAAIPG